jgi:hypothetical protein
MPRVRGAIQPIYHSRYAIAHMSHVEVQQITQFEMTKSKIAKQLTAVHRKYRLDGLQLDDDAPVDEKIDSVSIVDNDAVVRKWDRDLTLNGQASLCQLTDEATLICTFEQARS